MFDSFRLRFFLCDSDTVAPITLALFKNSSFTTFYAIILA